MNSRAGNYRGQQHINNTQLALTPAQLNALPPHERSQYVAGLSPNHQALYQSLMTQDQNRNFMQLSLEKTAYCPVTGGNGQFANWTLGQTLYFDFPTVAGFAKGLLIKYNLTVNPATGTNASYAVGPAAPFNIFSELQVLFNGPQVRTHPFFGCGILPFLNGRMTGWQDRVVAGFNDATVAANVVGTTPIVIGSNNTWQGQMYLPLTAISDETPAGILPLMGVGNKPQLKLTCTPQFLGLGSLMNPLIPTGAGSGYAVTVTGTVNVDVVFLDGTTMGDPNPLTLDWQREPTVQMYWDTALTPFNANTLQRQTISTKLEHIYVVSIIIDGGQSSSFSTYSNILGFELGPDQVGQQTFINWNISNNESIMNFFSRWVRDVWRQDMPSPGIIPWVAAPSRGVVNPTNRNGKQALNMYPGGFPATTHTYQVNSVGGMATPTGFATQDTPRVETFLVSRNNAGLKVA
jgi:hypothetical protein